MLILQSITKVLFLYSRMGSVSNPWNVPSIQDFLFFCCPECDCKLKNSQDFINHALLSHAEAKNSFSMKNEIKTLGIKINENQVEKEQIKEPVKISIMKRRLEEDPEFALDSKIQKLESTKDHDSDQDEHIEQGINVDSDEEDETVLKEPEGIFVCDTDNCEKIFETKIELENHSKQIHCKIVDKTEQQWKCDKCDSSFPSESQLNYHVKVTHKLRTKNVCYNCEILFQDFETFRAHVDSKHKHEWDSHIENTHSVNTVNKKYKCDKCDTFFSKHYKIWLKHTKHCNGKTEELTLETKDTKLEIKCDTLLVSEFDTKNVTKCDTTDNKTQESKFHLIEVKEDDCIKVEEVDDDTKTKNEVGFGNSNKTLKCFKCDLTFPIESELNYHTKITHKDRVRNVCFNCEMMFEDNESFRSHVDTIHKVDNKYKCHNCPKETNGYKHWLKHTKYCGTTLTRDDTGGFECDKCDRVFSTEKYLNRHQETHHLGIEKMPKLKTKKEKKNKEKKCDKCDMKFESNNSLHYHIVKVHEDQVTCEICGFVTNKHNMITHRTKKHHLYIIPSEKMVKKCDTCDTEFKSGEKMDNHLRECHDCDQQFECKECDKIWVSPLSLELHYVEVHQKIMYCCDTCGHAFVEPAQVKRHKKLVHEKSFDNVCHICGKAFGMPCILKEHLAIFHDIGEKSFICDQCDKVFLRLNDLKNHIEGVHLKNVKYHCDQCSYFGYTKRQLSKHKLRTCSKKILH